VVGEPSIVICANQAWNLVHFRASVIRALLADGWQVLALAPYDPVWSARLADMGCRCIDVPMDGAGMHPLAELRCLWTIARLLRRHRPAAWLSWTIKPNIYGALAARALGIAAFPNVSGLGTLFIREGWLTRIAMWLYRFSLRRCPAVFFQNGDDKALFVSRGLVSEAQAWLLPGSGIDLDHFRPETPGRPIRRHFLLVARLLGDKGVREFVSAAQAMKARWPDARFVLLGEVGAANRTAIGHEEVEAWVAQGIVEWQPPVVDVRPAMAAADWIVLPSYREGLSRVLVEAAAMGRPMVTSDVPGCRDVVEEGVNGFLAQARDAASLEAAMERAALCDDMNWVRMAAESRAKAQRCFAVERVVDIYRKALAEAGILAPLW
jgi:glycosyltransferase involved in cell wall biosynthesis